MSPLVDKLSTILGRAIEHDYQMQGKSVDVSLIMKQSQAISGELVATYPNITAQELEDIVPLVRRLYSFINFHNINRAMQSEEFRSLKNELSKTRAPLSIAQDYNIDLASPLYTCVAKELYEKLKPSHTLYSCQLEYEKAIDELQIFQMANQVEAQMLQAGYDSDTPIEAIPKEFLR